MATAKHRWIDRLRRRSLHLRKISELGAELQRTSPATPSRDEDVVDDEVGDDVLRLMFTACHPVLPAEQRVALTLRLIGGLTTAEIARAFLAAEATIAQRIVRAKRAIAKAGIRFEVPDGGERAARLVSVLEVLYLIFNEGYAATAGPGWMRRTLCEEAMRLARVLAGLMPDEPEVHGLVALTELHGSRFSARLSAAGEPVLLNDQDRSRWDHVLITRGLAALARAERLSRAPGPYTLQAAIAACHARARGPEETDWPRIVTLYTALAELTPSPVVALNKAVAVGMAAGPAAGLALVDRLVSLPAMQGYCYLPSVRGHLLEQLGRTDEARREFERAASLTGNGHEQRVLLGRARRLTEL
jgi:predicted RNA polymerase sigma factor